MPRPAICCTAPARNAKREISHAKFVVLPAERHHYFVSDAVAVHRAIREFIELERRSDFGEKASIHQHNLTLNKIDAGIDAAAFPTSAPMWLLKSMCVGDRKQAG